MDFLPKSQSSQSRSQQNSLNIYNWDGGLLQKYVGQIWEIGLKSVPRISMITWPAHLRECGFLFQALCCHRSFFDDFSVPQMKIFVHSCILCRKTQPRLKNKVFFPIAETVERRKRKVGFSRPQFAPKPETRLVFFFQRFQNGRGINAERVQIEWSSKWWNFSRQIQSYFF